MGALDETGKMCIVIVIGFVCRAEGHHGEGGIMDKDFLIRTYAQMYDPEAGPWNLGVENKYLEYQFARFFQENFEVKPGAKLCNVGIGAGAWDRFLSYQCKDGSLTSIDRDELCCRQLAEGLRCEGNPSKVRILCADVMTLELEESFDLLTMVGSTHVESGLGIELLEKVMGFVKPGGSFYYQTLGAKLPMDEAIRAAHRCGLRIENYQRDDQYGFFCQYFKFVKA